MGALDFLTTDKTKEKSQSREFGSSQTDVLADTIKGLVNSLRESTSGTTTKGTKESADLIKGILATGGRYLDENFSKEKAIVDSKGAMDAAIQSVLDAGLGDIRTARTSSGVYNSTTSKIMTDNLSAQAARAGADLVQSTINEYAQIQLQGNSLLGELASVLQESETTFTQDSTQDTTGTESTKNTSKVTEEFDNSAIGSGTQTNRGSGLDMIQQVMDISAGGSK